MLENLILDGTYKPVECGVLVKQKTIRQSFGISQIEVSPSPASELMVSTPKKIQNAALCTVAVSCGYIIDDDIFNFPGTTEAFVQEGTGVVIDHHHILSSAHVFDFPKQLGPPPANLKYKYLFISPTC